MPLAAESRRPLGGNVAQRAEERAVAVVAVAERGGLAVSPPLARRETWRRRLVTIQWQCVILVAAVLDLAVACADGNARTEAESRAQTGVQVVQVIALCIFVADISLRLYVFRPALFCKVGWNLVDLALVCLAVVVSVAELAALSAGPNVLAGGISIARGLLAGRVLAATVRAVRVGRAGRLLFRAGKGTTLAARYLTGENKARYVDLAEGFDLDLTYITPHLVAMSVPATGWISLFRNPLGEVARLLEAKHGAHGYSLVNCCPELPYEHGRFAHAVVDAYDIQDHTPPTMAQFVHFLNSVGPRAAADARHAVVVHCRGGKGRTGSMCCAWLLYTRECVDADDALALFALARTELGLGSTKLQGVDTPSQRRYVVQLSSMLRAQGAYLDTAAQTGRPTHAAHAHVPTSAAAQHRAPARPPPVRRAPPPRALRLPPCPRLILTSLTIDSWWRRLPRLGGPLVCAVHLMTADRPGGTVVFWSRPLTLAHAGSGAGRGRAAGGDRGGGAGAGGARSGGGNGGGDAGADARGAADASAAEEGGIGLSRGPVAGSAARVRGAMRSAGDALGGVAAGARQTRLPRQRARAEHAALVFSLEQLCVRGDVRVSVFELLPLERARDARIKAGLCAQQPWDCAPRPAWAHGGEGGEGDADSASVYTAGGGSLADLDSIPPSPRDSGGAGGAGGGGGTAGPEPPAEVGEDVLRELRRMGTRERGAAARVVAGSEPGCRFYFQFHSGFVPAGSLAVPLAQMDRACKDKTGRYDPAGIASFSYEHLDSAAHDATPAPRREGDGGAGGGSDGGGARAADLAAGARASQLSQAISAATIDLVMAQRAHTGEDGAGADLVDLTDGNTRLNAQRHKAANGGAAGGSQLMGTDCGRASAAAEEAALELGWTAAGGGRAANAFGGAQLAGAASPAVVASIASARVAVYTADAPAPSRAPSEPGSAAERSPVPPRAEAAAAHRHSAQPTPPPRGAPTSDRHVPPRSLGAPPSPASLTTS